MWLWCVCQWKMRTRALCGVVVLLCDTRTTTMAAAACGCYLLWCASDLDSPCGLLWLLTRWRRRSRRRKGAWGWRPVGYCWWCWTVSGLKDVGAKQETHMTHHESHKTDLDAVHDVGHEVVVERDVDAVEPRVELRDGALGPQLVDGPVLLLASRSFTAVCLFVCCCFFFGGGA